MNFIRSHANYLPGYCISLYKRSSKHKLKFYFKIRHMNLTKRGKFWKTMFLKRILKYLNGQCNTTYYRICKQYYSIFIFKNETFLMVFNPPNHLMLGREWGEEVANES